MRIGHKRSMALRLSSRSCAMRWLKSLLRIIELRMDVAKSWLLEGSSWSSMSLIFCRSRSLGMGGVMLLYESQMLFSLSVVWYPSVRRSC